MWTTSYIRRHICRLADGTLHTTRDFLKYGSRAAVDQTLYRMVKEGYLRRLARGVFRQASCRLPLPTPFAVAMAKARAFGRDIMTDGADAALALGLATSGNSEPTFASTGPTTQFCLGSWTVRLRGSCPRKTMLGDTAVGLILRALWHMGRWDVNSAVVALAARNLGRRERAKLRQSAGLMPYWVSNLVV